MNKEIWLNQLAFNKMLFKETYELNIESLSVADRTKLAKEFYFHINKELVDVIECLPNWKMHYKNEENNSEIVTSNLIEEYVDVFKYFMGLGQILGVTLEDIQKGYKNKTEVVKQKYNQNRKIFELQEKEVVVFDIDGVINTWPDCYYDWLRKKKGLDFSSHRQMKSSLDLKTYESLKTEYRLSGAKRTQPVNEETIKLMNILKDRGETIVLFTNRPVSKYKIIYSDTLHWLKTHHIPFDAIYWSDYNKKEDIYKLKLKIKFIVEDNLDNAKSFNRENHLVFLLQKSYNVDKFYKNKKLIRIKNPLEIISNYVKQV